MFQKNFWTGGHASPSPHNLIQTVNLKNISKSNKTRINNQIQAPKLRVLGADGTYIGIMSKEEALAEAEKKGLDLVEISPTADPPVCKIIDHGKYKYQQQKKEQKKSKKTHQPEMKTLKLSFSISEHDMKIRANSAKKFLERGDKVRVVLPLRGRENALQSTARKKMKKYIEIVSEEIDINIEKQIKKEPQGLTMTLTSNKS